MQFVSRQSLRVNGGLNNLLKTKKLDKTAEVSWQDSKMLIREAVPGDANAIWRILEPIICAGETYPLPRDMNRESALAYWFSLSVVYAFLPLSCVLDEAILERVETDDGQPSATVQHA